MLNHFVVTVILITKIQRKGTEKQKKNVLKFVKYILCIKHYITPSFIVILRDNMQKLMYVDSRLIKNPLFYCSFKYAIGIQSFQINPQLIKYTGPKEAVISKANSFVHCRHLH